MNPNLLLATRQAIAVLELLSNGTTQSFDADTAGVKGKGNGSNKHGPRNGHVRPPKRVEGEHGREDWRDRQPEIVVFRRRLSNARTDEHLEAIRVDAEQVTREIRYSKRPNVDCTTREGRLLVGTDPRPMSVLVHVYGYTERHIYRLRAEARELQARLRADGVGFAD